MSRIFNHVGNCNTHIANTWQSKGNQTMKFSQLIEYNKRNNFLQKLCGKWGRRTSSRPLFVFEKKLSMRWKQVVFILSGFNKNKLYKLSDYWSRDMANFNFSEKGMGLVSPPHFVYDFSKKKILILNSINWPNFIFRLLLLLRILDNMGITIVC